MRKNENSQDNNEENETPYRYKSRLEWYYHNNKKLIIRVISLTAVIILFILVTLGFIDNTEIKKKSNGNLKVTSLTVEDKQYIKRSIDNIEPYEKKLIKITTDKKKDTEKFSNNSISSKEYLSYLNRYNEVCTEIIGSITKIDCASKVNNLKVDVSSEYREFQDGIIHEINFINGKDQKEMNLADESYGEFMKTYENNKSVLEDAYKLCK